jgi:hypothetical protein
MSQSFSSLSFSLDMFNFIEDTLTRNCMLNGVWAMNQTNMWNWLRDFTPDESKGFMFSNATELNTIGHMMESSESPVLISHSGASFAITVKNLKYIAVNGIDAYSTLFVKCDCV